jgi:sporulation protein YlmC with PRC-barrel domain
MKRNINSLTGFKIVATDGELGEVTDFYFDDQAWTIRYLVVKTGGWLSGRKVLISPQSVIKDDVTGGKILVNLTQEQIRTSPDIGTDLPVSRQQREILHRHHAWESYWESQVSGGGENADNTDPNKIKGDDGSPTYDLHLQSAKAVSGYTIHASDGEIGHLNNYIIDDEMWVLTELVVDTANFFGGKKVLIDVNHVEGVDWHNFELFINITKDAIKSSPEYLETK